MAGVAKALSQLIICLQLSIMNCKIVCKNFKNWLSVPIDHLQQNFTIHDWFAIVKVEVLLLHFSFESTFVGFGYNSHNHGLLPISEPTLPSI